MATGFKWILGALELPRVSALIVQQAGVIVALVEELEDTGQGLRFSGMSSARRS